MNNIENTWGNIPNFFFRYNNLCFQDWILGTSGEEIDQLTPSGQVKAVQTSFYKVYDVGVWDGNNRLTVSLTLFLLSKSLTYFLKFLLSKWYIKFLPNFWWKFLMTIFDDIFDDNFWWQFLTIFVTILTNLTIFDKFEHFWQFKFFFDNFWHFMTILDNF